MKVRAIIVTFLLATIAFWGCQGGEDRGGGGDDDTSDDENAIKAVVQELIEGYLEGTEDSLNEKVFPHISEDYSYAGFDKEALQQSMLDDILDEERPEFGKPTIEQDVKIDGKKATDDAAAQADISMPWAEEEIGFPLSGQANLAKTFELKKESGGKWRVTAMKSGSSSMALSGAKAGSEGSLPELSNVAISPADKVAPEGSVSLVGSANLDTDNYAYFGWFSLDWYDFIPNLSSPSDDGDSIYHYDFSTVKGSFSLDATLPDDGTPEGLEIPKVLNLGDDTVSAQLVIVAIPSKTKQGGEPVSAIFYMWFIPLRPFENKDLESCDSEPLSEENHSGVWLMQIPVIKANLLVDLTIEETKAAGWISYVDHTTTPQQVIFLASGDLTDEDVVVLQFIATEGCPPDDPRVIEYTLNFTGTSGNGTLSVSGCGEEPGEAGLLLSKLSNRCEYITNYEDILGSDWTLVDPGSNAHPMAINAEPAPTQCYEVVINSTTNFSMCRAVNMGWGYMTTKNGYDLGFAFHDANSGVAVFSNYSTGEYALGEFSR